MVDTVCLRTGGTKMLLIAKFDTTNIEQRIAAFEKKHNIILPEQYRNFMLKYNGGYTPDTTFKVKPRRKEDVSGFYGLDIGDEYDFEKLFWLKYQIQDGYFPIADDCFGNEYFIGIKKSNYGKIYFYDHEEQKTELVRSDFKSFVESCSSKKLGRVRSIAEREESMAAKGRSEFVTDMLRSAWQEEIDFYGNMVQEKVILD